MGRQGGEFVPSLSANPKAASPAVPWVDAGGEWANARREERERRTGMNRPEQTRRYAFSRQPAVRDIAFTCPALLGDWQAGAEN